MSALSERQESVDETISGVSQAWRGDSSDRTHVLCKFGRNNNRLAFPILNFWPAKNASEIVSRSISGEFAAAKSDAYKVHALVRMQVPQPASPVSGVLFSRWGRI